jgi:hypothetical protein
MFGSKQGRTKACYDKTCVGSVLIWRQIVSLFATYRAIRG